MAASMKTFTSIKRQHIFKHCHLLQQYLLTRSCQSVKQDPARSYSSDNHDVKSRNEDFLGINDFDDRTSHHFPIKTDPTSKTYKRSVGEESKHYVSDKQIFDITETNQHANANYRTVSLNSHVRKEKHGGKNNKTPTTTARRERFDSKVSSDNFIDGQYFSYSSNQKYQSTQNISFDDIHSEHADTNSGHTFSDDIKQFNNDIEPDITGSAFIDEQYFDDRKGNQRDWKSKSNGAKIPNVMSSEHLDYNRNDMKFVDDQYFGKHSDESNMNNVKSSENGNDAIKQPRMKDKHKPKPNKENLETAYDVAMKIRHDKKQIKQISDESENKEFKYNGPVDSKGFRILKYQVPDIMNTPSGMVVDALRKNIIFNRGDVLAIDKPYGLPSHGGPGIHMSVGQLLPQLADVLDPSGGISSLHLIHRLDKETTGVMLLAKSAEMAYELRGYFRRREVIKTYWAITKGIPKPPEGVIKIPISTGDIGKGIYRMSLKPEYKSELSVVMKKRNTNEASEAITRYKVLKQDGTAALIECQPVTGIKHQIRVHLGFGLNTPILGDHKYSHYSKIAPQRLFGDMLQKLGIRQSKARHVPMHLHAKKLIIPEFENGRNLLITANLPQHFVINMRRLKLKR